jgi:hypothetical protein
MYVEMAKCVRNSTMSNEGRRSVIQLMCEVFRADNQQFDEKVFRAIANAELEDDFGNRKGVKKDEV